MNKGLGARASAATSGPVVLEKAQTVFVLEKAQTVAVLEPGLFQNASGWGAAAEPVRWHSSWTLDQSECVWEARGRSWWPRQSPGAAGKAQLQLGLCGVSWASLGDCTIFFLQIVLGSRGCRGGLVVVKCCLDIHVQYSLIYLCFVCVDLHHCFYWFKTKTT